MATTQNPIASLESRATTESATASAPVALKTGNNITGQYLFDRFCSNKADITKMQVIENAVTGGVSVDQFKTATADMVKIAEKHSEAAKKTAANHSAVLRNVFGAWLHCADAFHGAGFEPGKTGYHIANTLAKKTLKDAGIRWTGEQGKSAEQREADAQARIRRDAIAEAMTGTPQKQGESMESFLERVKMVSDATILEQEQARKEKKVGKLVDSIKAMSGPLLDDVLLALLDELGYSITIVEGNSEQETASSAAAAG